MAMEALDPFLLAPIYQDAMLLFSSWDLPIDTDCMLKLLYLWAGLRDRLRPIALFERES